MRCGWGRTDFASYPFRFLRAMADVRGVDDRVALLEFHDADALRRAAGLADLEDAGADDDAFARYDHDLVVGLHEQLLDDIAVLLGAVERFDALTAAIRLAIVVDRRALAVAVARDDEDLSAILADDVHRDDVRTPGEAHGAHAAARAAHRANGLLIEADRVAVRCREHELGGAVGQLDVEQFIALHEIDRDEPGAADAAEIGERRLLYVSAPRHHDEELFGAERADREHGGDGLARRQRQQVDERRAARLSRRVGDLMRAQPVDAPAIGEEEDVLVRRRREEMARHVFLLEVDAGDAAAAAVLRAKRIDVLALDVPAGRHGDDDVRVGDEVLDGELALGF